MDMIKQIGYQGIEGSNSEAAAKNMAEKLGWTETQFVPLTTSRGVMDALCAGQTDYGVLAIHNSVAGPVEETNSALEGVAYKVLADDSFHNHHCLFVRDPSVTTIDTVASHIQALSQCRSHLAEQFPDARWYELEDTAIGARYLYDGTLPASAGVLCRRNAGEAFGLHLLRENLEDNCNNITSFILIELEAHS